MIRKNCRVIGVALLTTLLASGPQVAMAGFEWTPPPPPTELADDSALPALTPEMPAMPAADVDGVTLGQQPQAAAPALTIEPEPMAAAQLARPRPPMPPGMIAAMQQDGGNLAATPVPPASSYAEAVGFGTDMPLAFAMRQIVPPEYAFAFDPSVDHGARVSWNGGKPWDMVLTETLLPLGLASVIDGTTVRVVPIGSVPAQMPVMAAAPAPFAPPVQMPVDMMAAPAMPMQTISHAPVAEAAPAHEVYIRRQEKPRGEAEGGKSFWSRLGLGGDDDNNAWKKKSSPEPEQPVAQQFAEPITAAPVPEPIPLMTTEPQESAYTPVPLVNQQISYVEDTSYTSAPPAPAGQEYVAPAMAQVPVMPAVEPVSQPVSVPAYVPPPAMPEPAPVQQAAAPAELPVDLYEIRYWQSEKGDSLRNTLSTWSKSASVELYWDVDEDYILPEPVRLHGSYTDAVARLLSLYEEKDDRPLGRLHPNLPKGPSVLVVEQYRSNS